MSDAAPPVPDVEIKPKPAAQMAREGEREGPVLTDAAHSDGEGEGTAEDPQFAHNGD